MFHMEGTSELGDRGYFQVDDYPRGQQEYKAPCSGNGGMCGVTRFLEDYWPKSV